MQSPQADFSAAIERLNQGEFRQAAAVCDQILQANPDDAKSWHLRGIALAQEGDSDEAVQSFQRAIELCGDRAIYHYNLALAYQTLGQSGRAIDAYRRAVEIQPEFVEAQTNLGNCIAEDGDLSQAIEHFRGLVATHPDEAGFHFNLANTLYESGELLEALTPYRKAIEVDPDLARARENLGRTLLDVMRDDDAAEVWKEWLEHDPDNVIARHLVAAVSGEGVPERCDDEYVRETFGGEFANDYESQLERIEYRVPELIGTAIESLKLAAHDRVVLDAGCGTGLCADLLRPLASRLVGVDLSAEMLGGASKRNIYDGLVEAELTGFLESAEDAYDLIVCGDTLCYFGNLDAVLGGFARRLADGGSLVFTVEALESDAGERPIDLQPSGRYRHAESYIRNAVDQAGLRVIDVVHDWLRKERGHEVAGLVVSAGA